MYFIGKKVRQLIPFCSSHFKQSTVPLKFSHYFQFIRA